MLLKVSKRMLAPPSLPEGYRILKLVEKKACQLTILGSRIILKLASFLLRKQETR